VPPRPAPPRYAPNPRPSSTAEPVPPAAVSASSPPSSSSASVSGLPTPTPQRLGPRDASAGAPPSGICFQATTPGQRPSHSNSWCVWQFKPCAEAGLDGAGDVDDMEEYIESFGETYLLGASHSSCSMGDFRPCYVFTVDIFLCRLL
jgi:hypothetical protein